MTQRTCDQCGQGFTARRNDARFCSKACSSKSFRQRNERRCSIDGCDNPHGARGLCYSHYGTWHRKKNGRTSNGSHFAITCIVCSATHMATRPQGQFCSDDCKAAHYRATRRTKSKLPADHPVMLLIAETKRRQAEQRRKPKPESYHWRTARECPGCACTFTPLYTPTAICCSNRCTKRMSRQRRRAREAGAAGTFTWSEFMQIARRFNYCCAYCGDKPDRLDPDHAVPLSHGGSNSPSNLLPTCLMCNSSKCAMTLPEWSDWLASRDMPARRTTWVTGDPRYVHLTDAALISWAA